MLQQYLEIKEQHPDAILFYRMGDFYEMFFEDAAVASRILGITLTSRSHKDEEHKVPMCGVPYHAVTGYLGKMIKAGYRVALCEQTEDPKEAKGIVKRGVVRVVSPGTTTDSQLLDEKANSYVCAVSLSRKTGKQFLAGLAFLDVTTGAFHLNETPFSPTNPGPLLDDITRLQPAEILLAKTEHEILSDVISLLDGPCVTVRPEYQFESNAARSALTEHFQVTSLAGFGCEDFTAAICAAGALFRYIQDTQKTDLSYIRQISPLTQKGYLIIDDSSRRNLEITETIVGAKREGSLLAILDQTCTPMGARLLRKRLLFPLQNKEEIIARLDSVEELSRNSVTREGVRQLLSTISDLERLCSRLVLGHGNARDLGAIKSSLGHIPEFKQLIMGCSSPLLHSLAAEIDVLSDLHTLIDLAIRDDAPISLREGNLIREGFHPELDRIIVLLRDGKKLILELENAERERSGLAKLKVGYNKVFGYYFEVSRHQASNIPDYFIRKQTLVNAERFITPELKELETSISSAQENRLELEYTLFIDVRDQLASQSQRLLDTAAKIAQVDVLACLAELAIRHHYCRPTINDGHDILITEGRHPVIELALEPGRFVPNDIRLDRSTNQLLIITGPNMAGKSTVLRQTALIVLLAHIGSFVPAEHADICLVDRIFTRVGAMDDLRRGQSTFMVEMNETANILNNATEDSLVILDEIGRGTSTYDGLSIAWAVAEELVKKNGIGIKTLFATHYHELTDLPLTHKKIQNYSIAVRENNSKIAFLHKLVPGATNRSYGIHVAALAGVPTHVIDRANQLLKNIELGEFNLKGQPRIAAGLRSKKQPLQLALFSPQHDAIAELLEGISPDDLSPRQALDLLYQLIRIKDKII